MLRRLADSKSVQVLFNLSSKVTRFTEYVFSNFFSSMQLFDRKRCKIIIYLLMRCYTKHLYIAASFCSISHSKVAYFALMSSRKSNVLLFRIDTDISILSKSNQRYYCKNGFFHFFHKIIVSLTFCFVISSIATSKFPSILLPIATTTYEWHTHPKT